MFTTNPGRIVDEHDTEGSDMKMDSTGASRTV